MTWKCYELNGFEKKNWRTPQMRIECLMSLCFRLFVNK